MLALQINPNDPMFWVMVVIALSFIIIAVAMIAIAVFVNRAVKSVTRLEERLEPLIDRAAQTGCVVTHGLGPRYLHSTGQLHKGGPPEGRFVQVVDDPGEEVSIPERPFGFGTLIRAQADGDLASLRERGRPIVRVNLEEVV